MHMLTGPCLDYTKVTRTKKKFLCSTTLLLPSLPNRRFFCECCNSVVESYTFFCFCFGGKKGKAFCFFRYLSWDKRTKGGSISSYKSKFWWFSSKKITKKVFDNKWEIIISLCFRYSFHCITFHPNWLSYYYGELRIWKLISGTWLHCALKVLSWLVGKNLK